MILIAVWIVLNLVVALWVVNRAKRVKDQDRTAMKQAVRRAEDGCACSRDDLPFWKNANPYTPVHRDKRIPVVTDVSR